MYKTIVLTLLEQCPELHEKLRMQRMLLSTLNLYATQLKGRHETWKDYLSKSKPESEERQVASEALEIAVKELEDCLTSGVPANESDLVSLDGAMAFIRGHEPPA